MINLIFCYLKVSDSGEVLRDLTHETQNVQVSVTAKHLNYVIFGFFSFVFFNIQHQFISR